MNSMPSRRQPDAVARWFSHLLVGAVAVYLFGRKSGAGGRFLVACVSAFAHEELDAPVAQVFADLGL